jgi:hypothetical protein
VFAVSLHGPRFPLIPAKAGTQMRDGSARPAFTDDGFQHCPAALWIPAFAGMSGVIGDKVGSGYR